mmetsp:Transcript_24877/g.56044  ORF Transcript_24877/g.56044 Transcript_24877/m.56044 type:complete len:146 (+) Transcript_24877:64-501(+)|eukprot:CAMPEP_0172587526 /NCGR_PEP_ID=MMETSP1068-20121228/6560_1 /TAXON_ID=35684 /ORGANISM="Pseudopedinella elastica, Strain CCMP716" /LENGTH=145 /DNA_ID=CAMNT_0013382579 /DNA_START=62 /DNA_END=499 /DNA_ORIENTATION=-
MLRASIFLVAIFSVLDSAVAFAPSKASSLSLRSNWAGARARTRDTVRRRGADEDLQAAEELEAIAAAKEESAAASEEEVLAQAWVDPNAASGVAWYELSWWGYLIILYPAILFLDDGLHFLPEGGVIGFFQQLAGIDNSLDAANI